MSNDSCAAFNDPDLPFSMVNLNVRTIKSQDRRGDPCVNFIDKDGKYIATFYGICDDMEKLRSNIELCMIAVCGALLKDG